MKRFIVTAPVGNKEIKAVDLLDAALHILDEEGIGISLHPAEIYMQKALPPPVPVPENE